jgi:hypothetical protein
MYLVLLFAEYINETECSSNISRVFTFIEFLVLFLRASRGL